MEKFPCNITVTTFDRRKRFQTKKVYEYDAFFSARYIKEDKSFHMIVNGGTKTEVFISSKLQISNNIATLGTLTLNIPEFRCLVELQTTVIDEIPDTTHQTLFKIMSVLSRQDIESATDVLFEAAADENKENNNCFANQTTPEKQRPSSSIPLEKKKLRSPLKSGYTPSKKKDRLGSVRSSPLKATQTSSFMPSKMIFSSNNNVSSRGRSRNGYSRESLSPGDVALTKSQEDVLERCKGGANVFLTGGAGTGKSYLLKCILDEMVSLHGKQAVFVTATTGIAAVSIGGITVHQFAGIRPGDTIAEVGDTFKQVGLYFAKDNNILGTAVCL
jgi:DNA replication protein DnaC